MVTYTIQKYKQLLLFALFLGLLLLFPQASAPKPLFDPALDDGFIPLATWDGISIGGYASKASVIPGESLDFHISNDKASYNLQIWREGGTRQLMTTISNLTGAVYDCTGGYAPPGCGWPIAHSFTVPANWPTGIYTVEFETNVKGTRSLPFWVREPNPGTTASMLFISSINTYHAYNNFGGKSLYNNSSSDSQRAYKVSFNRPFANGKGRGDLSLELEFVEWAEADGYELEYATSQDLHFMPNLLDAYEVLVISGHSEYWSWDMRQALKDFIKAGGRFVNLSGNTMWWQVRYEDGTRTLVEYKDRSLDPETDPTLVTDNTWDVPISDPEYAIFGAHWLSGGYFQSPNQPTYQYADGYGGYWVNQADHWVFEGAGLAQGDVLGRGVSAGTSVLGDEMDGNAFNCEADGRTIRGPMANNGSPDNLKILAIAPTARLDDYGFAVIGMYTDPSGGAVFAANSTGWGDGFANADSTQVTRNVLDRFLANDIPQESRTSPDSNYLFYDRFNCYNLDHNGVLPSYSGPEWYAGKGIIAYNYTLYAGNVDEAYYTPTCGIDGSGLRIVVDNQNPLRLRAQVKPGWASSDVLYSRLYIDLSDLSMQNNKEFFLLKYISTDRLTDSDTTQGQLRVRYRNGKHQVMFGPQHAGGAGYLDVPSNAPFLLETLWDKPNNLISFWVDGTRLDLNIDLSERDSLNRVDLALSGLDPQTQGSFCVDEFAFDSDRIGALAQSPTSFDLGPNQTLSTLPDQNLTLSYTLTNTGQASDTFDLSLETNSLDWPVGLSRNELGPVSPGNTATFTMSVQVPSDAIELSQNIIQIQAKGQNDTLAEEVVTSKIDVSSLPSLAISPDTSHLLQPTGKLTLTQYLTNTSSISTNLDLHLTGLPQNWGGSLSPTSMNNLLAGETRPVTLSLQVPDNAFAGETELALLSATVSALPDIEVSSRHTLTVDAVYQLDLSAGITLTLQRGDTLSFTHVLTNRGNITDHIDLSLNSTTTWPASLLGDTSPVLGPGQTSAIILSATVPLTSSAHEQAVFTISGQSQTQVESQAQTINRVTVAPDWGLTMSPNQSQSADPGQTIHIQQVLSNSGNLSDTVNLSVTSNQAGWSPALLPEALTLGGGQSSSLTLSVTLPISALVQHQALFTVTGQSQGDPALAVSRVHQVRVNPVYSLSLSADQAYPVTSSQVYSFQHHITNTSNISANIRFSLDPDFDEQMREQEKWHFSLSPSALWLMPGETAALTLEVRVPDTMDLGQSQVAVTLGAALEAAPDVVVQNQTLLTLASILGLALSPGQNQALFAGSQVIMYHSLTNTGNITSTYNLQVSHNQPMWSVALSPTQLLDLAPQTQAAVALSIDVPEGTAVDTQAEIILEASLAADPTMVVSNTNLISLETFRNIALSSGYEQALDPAQSVTFNHSLTNLGNITDSFSLELLNLPPTWAATLSPQAISDLAPDQSATFSLTVEAPKDALAYTQLALQLKTQSNSNLSLQKTLTDIITINPVYAFSLEGDVSALLEANETQHQMLSLKNEGNISDTYTLQLSQSPDHFDLDLDPEQVTNLAPGAETILDLTITGAEASTQSLESQLALTVSSANQPALSQRLQGLLKQVPLTQTQTPTQTETPTQTQNPLGLAYAAPPHHSGQPGQTLLYTYILSNSGSSQTLLTISVDIDPEDWSYQLLPPSPLTLEPGETVTLTLNLAIPENLLTDTTAIIALMVQADSLTQSLSLTHTLDITLEPELSQGLTLRINDLPDEVVPGQIMSLQGTVTNTGNMTDSFNLDISSNQDDLAFNLPTDAFLEIPPQKSRNFILDIRLPQNLAAQENLELVFRFNSQQNPDFGLRRTYNFRVAAHYAFALDDSINLSALPGEMLTLSHHVTNTGNISDVYQIRLTSAFAQWTTSPTTWQTGPLAPGASDVITWPIQVPEQTLAATKARFEISVESLGDTSLRQRRVDRIEVEAQRGLQLSPGQSQTATLGDTLEFIHILSNTGNITSSFVPRVSMSSPGWEISLSPATFNDLAPFAQRSFTLRVTVPETLTTSLENELQLGFAILGDTRIEANILDRVKVTVAEPERFELYLPLLLSN